MRRDCAVLLPILILVESVLILHSRVQVCVGVENASTIQTFVSEHASTLGRLSKAFTELCRFTISQV